mgnify:CR=1 FL=1
MLEKKKKQSNYKHLCSEKESTKIMQKELEIGAEECSDNTYTANGGNSGGTTRHRGVVRATLYREHAGVVVMTRGHR